MENFLKKWLKKLIRGPKCDQKTYIKYLRDGGATVGEDVNFFCIDKCQIDTLNLHLLTIGSHVNIVSSTILTHDYAWSVIHGKDGKILGNQRAVTIGNHIFIGDGSLILGGTTIEDNVIIGARSVVSGHLEHDSVYAGNPARKIMTLEEYTQKRESRQFDEAKKFVKKWIAAYGKDPEISNLHEYFYLFSDANTISPILMEKLKLNGSYEKSMEYLATHKPQFESFEAFLKACKE